MSDEFDKELDELVAGDRAPTTLEKAFGSLATIVELSKAGYSKAEICRRLDLQYAQICKAEKKHKVLWEAFRGIPPPEGDLPNVVAYSRRLEEDPASPANLKRIQEWSRDGVSWAAQSALLKMTEEQFAGYVKNSPRVAEAIRVGEAEQEALACAALSALTRDPTHKDHIRAVLALIERRSVPKVEKEQAEDVLTPEQILEALRNPTPR